MEDELKAAIAYNEQQLEAIADVLAEDPTNEEALQVLYCALATRPCMQAL